MAERKLFDAEKIEQYYRGFSLAKERKAGLAGNVFPVFYKLNIVSKVFNSQVPVFCLFARCARYYSVKTFPCGNVIATHAVFPMRRPEICGAPHHIGMVPGNQCKQCCRQPPHVGMPVVLQIPLRRGVIGGSRRTYGRGVFRHEPDVCQASLPVEK